MRIRSRKLRLFAIGMTATVAGTLGAAASANAQSVLGCPRGAVCVYPEGRSLSTLKKGPEPHEIYYSYGPHNLRGQYGFHVIVNNQYGGAGLTLCGGYNGTGGLHDVRSQVFSQLAIGVDLTPVNSITLWIPGGANFRRYITCGQ